MRLIFILIASIFFSYNSHATHAAGMDISYECISQGNTSDVYRVTLKFYRDCEGITAPGYGSNPLLQLQYTSSCGSGSSTLQTVGGAININPQCLSYCNGGSSLGIEQYTYETTITLSKCSNWTLSVCEPARNNAINTIVNPGGQDLCVQATLNNLNFCNNSPTFSQYPTPFICAGNYYCYNNGAIETDGDSLLYELVSPLNTANGGTVNYIAPYSINNPVGGGSTFDPITGNLCVTPPNIITGVLAIKVSEYRNGVLIGSIIRDIQINAFSCTATNPPGLTGINSNNVVDIADINTYTITLDCPNGNQNINFDINTINNNPPPPPGYEITINVGGGSWQSEVSWEIYDPSGSGAGTILASGGAPFSGTVCIPATNLGNLQLLMYDSWGDGWNGNTYTISGNNTISGQISGTLNFGTSGVNSFNISGGNACSIGGAFVNMSWNGGINGASFNISNNNTMNPVGTFNWTPTAADIANSPYFFTVDVANDACPVPGNFSFQYQIILNESNIDINPTIIDPSCNGLSNGSINITSNGSYPPFLYNWSSGQNTQNINNISSGTYTLTVTDSLGCYLNETYVLNEPPAFNPTINAYNISCFGANDGYIEVVNEPQTTTYFWSNFSTSNSITNLVSGNYSVDVTDSSGCVLSESFNISEPTDIVVSSYYNDISCFGANDGNITINISGGIPNYTIEIPPFNQTLLNGVTTYTTQALQPGTYVYYISDSNMCMKSDTILIDEPSQLITNPIITDVLCNNENSGSIILNTSGGTLPYIEDFGGFNPLQLSAGIYTYTVTDSNNCLSSDTFSINQPDSLFAIASSTDATCAGYFDGAAYLNIFGGTIPYYTNWNGSDPNALNAGTHNYVVTDENGCVAQGLVIINEPFGMQLSIDTFSVSCFGGNDGSAILNISGGAGSPYNTFWGGLNPNALPAGNHIVTVADSNNCSLTDTVFITQPPQLFTSPVIAHVSCFGYEDGNVDLQISGGIPPYTETWFGVDSSHLAPGNYSYQIVDANNCIKDSNITIFEPDTISVLASTTDVDCYGEDNGSVNLIISGGTSPFNTDFGTFNQYALEAGTYPFTITDINGCSYDSSITINEANELFLDFIATSPICRYEQSTLSINISNASNNIYTLELQDSIIKSFIIDTNGLLIPQGMPITLTPNYSGQVYILSLTDDEGCKQMFNDFVHIEVKQLPQLSLNEDDICFGESSYFLNSATPSGGTYYINNNLNNYFDVENLDFGDYLIRYEYTDPTTSCYNEIEEIITISDSPEAKMFFSPQPTDINDPNIFFRDNSDENIISSEWHLGDGTVIYDKLNFWHTYSDTGTYSIKYYITNEYNCTDSAFNFLKINPTFSVFIADAFTPNNDGNNDIFKPILNGEDSYVITIYDRWGSIIFSEENSSWDGFANGKPVPSGVYPYSISVKDFNQRLFIYPGTVKLLR